jgi:hypothetical protein
MPRWPGLALLLAAGLGGGAAAQLATGYDGQYTGELTLTKVMDEHDCTQPPLGARYPLTIAGGVVRFEYVPRFSTALSGRVDANGAFTASAPVRHGTVRMTGQIRGLRLTAVIVSPSCNYTFQAQQ